MPATYSASGKKKMSGRGTKDKVNMVKCEHLGNLGEAYENSW